MFDVLRSSFPKQEKIVSRTDIEKLFVEAKSHSVSNYPLRVVYSMKERQPEDLPVKLLVSVSKKHFKHAVDRNRVKRQIREIYRRNKQLLYSSIPDDKQMLVACLWLSSRHYSSGEIEGSLVSLMHRIKEKL